MSKEEADKARSTGLRKFQKKVRDLRQKFTSLSYYEALALVKQGYTAKTGIPAAKLQSSDEEEGVERSDDEMPVVTHVLFVSAEDRDYKLCAVTCNGTGKIAIEDISDVVIVHIDK